MNSLFILALIVAVVSRIFTQEEIFLEVQRWAANQQASNFPLWRRKLTYPLQCQFCFSVWVAIAITLYIRWAWPIAEIIGSILVIVGLANALLIIYELFTVQIARIRVGNRLRNVTLERRRLELADYKADSQVFTLHRKLALHEAQRRVAATERPFLGYSPNTPSQEWQ